MHSFKMVAKIAVLVATLGSVAVSSAAKTAAQYGQCGGQGYTGPTKCPSGWRCHKQDNYYSQCTTSAGRALPKTSDSKATGKAKAPAKTKKKVPTKKPSGTSNSKSSKKYKASFTQYGSTDTWGSGNCNVETVACGFYTSPGYSVAVSQALYGVGPGAGAGPACGTCWRLTIQTDSSGKRLGNAGTSIVAKVTNLCPADGNPLCAQRNLQSRNQYGAAVNFDTCIDSGASKALFQDSGTGLGLGTVEQVDCKLWKGKKIGNGY